MSWPLSSSREIRATGRGTCPQTKTGLVPPSAREWPCLQTEVRNVLLKLYTHLLLLTLFHLILMWHFVQISHSYNGLVLSVLLVMSVYILDQVIFIHIVILITFICLEFNNCCMLFGVRKE